MSRHPAAVWRYAGTSTVLLLSACAWDPVAESAPMIHDTPCPESLVDSSLTDSLGRSLAIEVDGRHRHEQWLLLSGYIQEDDGGEFDFRGSDYQSAIDAGAFENRFMALLDNVNGVGSCNLVALSFGSTDSPIDQWVEQFTVPAELFEGYTGTQSLQWQ